MAYTIRPAMLADVFGIAEVARATWDTTYAQIIAPHNRHQFLDRAYGPEALREAMEAEPGWFFVATAPEETIVGFAHYLRRFDAQGELVRIYVHPDHQRRGIGRAFLATGLAALAAAGISFCYVSVEVHNAGGRAFYERFGFALHQKHARFLGNQLIRLVEYIAPITDLLATLDSPPHSLPA